MPSSIYKVPLYPLKYRGFFYLRIEKVKKGKFRIKNPVKGTTNVTVIDPQFEERQAQFTTVPNSFIMP